MRLLIGQISYLNSQPFYPLLNEHRLIPTPPAELGRMAKNGEIDAGILATADYLLCEDRYEPIAGFGIANHEEVRSILFLSRKPMNELDGARIGITEETSTSVRLLRTLLEVRDGTRPAGYVRGLRDDADAFLVIGNEALRRNHETSPRFPYRYDLATEWWRWQGLPFVFALWTVRGRCPRTPRTSSRISSSAPSRSACRASTRSRPTTPEAWGSATPSRPISATSTTDSGRRR